MQARSIGIKWWYDYGNGRSVEGDLGHDEIKRMFEPCGPVEEIIPNMGPGIAYLRFENKDAMPKALEMHKTTYKGGSRNREGTLKVYAGGAVPDRSPSSARPPSCAPPSSLSPEAACRRHGRPTPGALCTCIYESASAPCERLI